MSTELTVFVLTVLLALIHIFVESAVKVSAYGIGVSVGPRDSMPETDSVLVGRAVRAKNNMLETLPLALGLLLLVHITGGSTAMTVAGAWIYLLARVVYLPLYLMGVPWLRTVVWGVALVGLVMLVLPFLG
jgi:uncharacterized MAPEG superfamily protein